MKRVAFCWELGGNYGHITSFLPFYRELIKAGIAVDFIIRDLGFAHQLLGEQGIRYVQAPLPRDEHGAQINTYTYTDLLAQIGYLDEGRLISYVSAWRDLFALLAADLIIADHAPTALLAARTLGVPATMFGSGFFNPPIQDPMPVFHVWSNVPDAVAHKHNEPVLATMNAVLAYFECPELEAVSDLFDVEERFLCTAPELDHYFNREGDEYWGPYFIEDIGIEPRWPDVEGPKIFAYVTPKIKNMEYFLDQLQQVAGSKLVHVPRASTELIERFAASDFRIESEPVRMGELLKAANMVINQAGVGTVSACALAGVRQVLIPTQLEQRMVCKKLVSLGLAYGVDPEQPKPDYKGVIEKALTCVLLGEKVRQFHHKYFGFSQQEQYSAMSDVIADILREN